jgi:hypothetical protein
LPKKIIYTKKNIVLIAGEKLPQEGNAKPDLSRYYPVSPEISVNELPEITLKNVSLGLLLLGLIAFMVNALMVYLFMKQSWIVIWPQTGGAQMGVFFMAIGGVAYFVNYVIEKKNL